MATLNLGKVLVTLEGEHNPSIAYDKYCEVTSNGSSYVSKQAVPIGTLITDTAFWQKRASKGDDGADAYEPFKGWFDSSSDLNTTYSSPKVGDFAYIKGTTTSDPVAIYYCAIEGTWEDSGREFNPSNNQEFASGQALNTVNIINNFITGGINNVLSAEKGKALKEEIDELPNCESGTTGDFEVSDESGNVLVRFENGHIKTKNFYSGNVYTKAEVNEIFSSGNVTQQQLQQALAAKQDTLISGTNIKTVNGVSILGNGNIDTRPHLKLLVLGNSYSADSFMYLPFILLNYGITIEVGVYHRPGASLQNQVDEWTTGNGGASFWFINTKNNTSWQVISSNYNPRSATLYRTWDIITIQQGSIASVDYSNFTTVARGLIGLIESAVNYPFTLAWNININRHSSGNDYTSIANQILSNINNICQREPVNLIFPYGTAIFDARTNNILAAIGDGGNLWASDKVHLQEGLPCYLAAITNIQALFNRFFPTLSVLNDAVGATITQSKINGWGVQGQHGSCTGISASNCRLAQICAVLANRFNFEIKTIY